jgi:hypothetical protein
MAGAAWASVVAQYTGAAVFLAVVYRRRGPLGLAAALEGPHRRALAAAAGAPPAERAALASAGRPAKAALMMRDLHWLAFVRQAAALTLRGVLILSTYTGASMVRGQSAPPPAAPHRSMPRWGSAAAGAAMPGDWS